MGIDCLKSMSRRAVFLDRDGVLNRNVFYADSGEFESPRFVEDLEIFSWTVTAAKLLSDQGFALFIVSNQPSFAKGKASLEQLVRVGARVREELEAAGVRLTRNYYCFHHPQSKVAGFGDCICRKPSPEFLLRAAAEFGIDLGASWFVGDRATDIECGRRAGVRTIRVAPDHPDAGWQEEHPLAEFQAKDLAAAAEIILRH